MAGYTLKQTLRPQNICRIVFVGGIMFDVGAANVNNTDNDGRMLFMQSRFQVEF